jgi:hypothetical protein
MDPTAEIIELKRRILVLEQALATAIPKGGQTPTLQQGVDCGGAVYPWSTFFAGGNSTREGYQVEKVCMRIGQNLAHARDVLDQTGPIGMSIGVSGEAISHYDFIPAAQTVTIPEAED